jgi:uncharacterized oxidoreductase
MSTDISTQLISREELLSLSTQILMKWKTPEKFAHSISESLVQAQEAGHASHGVIRLLEYTQLIDKKVIIPGIQPTIKSEFNASVVIDAHWGWGQIACKFAVEVATKKAKEFGVCAISIANCNHIGRVGEYSELFAEQNLISMTWCNADPAVAAFGGKDRLFGTNPFAAGIPTNADPVVIDFATAASAEGKLRVAKANGVSIPPATVIDKNGVESTDPNDFYEGGAILPFGGHKGYCLSLMIELLGGALSGNHPSMNSAYSHGFGTVMVVIDPDKFFGTVAFKDEMSEAVIAIKATPPANPKNPVLVPGDVENQQRQKNTPKIEISKSILDSIRAL